MNRNDPLPSWRPGSARDAVEAFLAAAEQVPVAGRVAYFDNDGTLWCERPSYVQLDFFLDAMHVEQRLRHLDHGTPKPVRGPTCRAPSAVKARAKELGEEPGEAEPTDTPRVS